MQKRHVSYCSQTGAGERWPFNHSRSVTIIVGTLKPEADIGADKPIAAQKDNQKIAVEVKSFIHSRGYQKPGFLIDNCFDEENLVAETRFLVLSRGDARGRSGVRSGVRSHFPVPDFATGPENTTASQGTPVTNPKRSGSELS